MDRICRGCFRAWSAIGSINDVQDSDANADCARGDSPGGNLSEAHRTLFPLKLGSMFVTVAILQGLTDGTVWIASAGHGTVSEHSALNPPLGDCPGAGVFRIDDSM